MASLKKSGGCTPFINLTNTSNACESIQSDVQPLIIDPRECKRQRERERYAHNKDEILKKRREARQEKKRSAAQANVEHHQVDGSQIFQMGLRQSALNEIQNTMSAKGTTHVLDPSCSPAYDTTKSSFLVGGPRCNKENNFPDENANWLRGNDMFGRDQENIVNITHANSSPVQLPEECPRATPTFLAENPRRRMLTNKQIEAKRTRERARHANMTPEQRQERRDRQKVQYALRRNYLGEDQLKTRHARHRVRCANMTPEQKKAKYDREKTLRKLRRNTLCKESLAMENPLWQGED